MPDLENIKVSATIIVISKDNKALIVQRPPDKAFPNLWTVAGGKLQDTDGCPKSEGFRYYSVEGCAIRELYEETGITVDVEQLKYLCSITTIWGDTRRVILSYYVVLHKDSKDVRIALDECKNYAWATERDMQRYHDKYLHLFIPDISGEILEVFEILKKKRRATIKRIMYGG